MNSREQKLKEVATANALIAMKEIEKNEALISYVAMMTDVELPEVNDERED